MTECERIIAQGILPEEFFKEEYIDDFFVDVERKKIWAVEIDLLLEFDRVCKKHNLKWFLMWGSLLGAVRHENGIIPWDDDFDVSMPREDYDKLLELGKEFKSPYFLQIPCQDNGYFYSFTKLRNSNTTSIKPWYRYEKFNMGIALDIVPLDKCLLDEVENNYNEIKELCIQNSTYMRLSNQNPSEKELIRMKDYNGQNPQIACQRIETIASKYKDKELEFITAAVITIYKCEQEIFHAVDFEKTVLANVYGHKFPIPANYDKILKTVYGDYMQFPPIDKRGTWHETYLSADISYLEYKKRELGI